MGMKNKKGGRKEKQQELVKEGRNEQKTMGNYGEMKKKFVGEQFEEKRKGGVKKKEKL